MSVENKIETVEDYMEFHRKTAGELDEKIMATADELPSKLLAEVLYKYGDSWAGIIAGQVLKKRKPDLHRRVNQVFDSLKHDTARIFAMIILEEF